MRTGPPFSHRTASLSLSVASLWIKRSFIRTPPPPPRSFYYSLPILGCLRIIKDFLSLSSYSAHQNSTTTTLTRELPFKIPFFRRLPLSRAPVAFVFRSSGCRVCARVFIHGCTFSSSSSSFTIRHTHTRVQNVPLFIFRSHCQSPVAEESPVLKKRERDGPKDVSSPTISPSQQIPCVRLLMKHRLLLPPIVCAFSLSVPWGMSVMPREERMSSINFSFFRRWTDRRRPSWHCPIGKTAVSINIHSSYAQPTPMSTIRT